MDYNDYQSQYAKGRVNQAKAIFANLFMLSNKMARLFEANIPVISLKQFMLLIFLRQEPHGQHLSHYAKHLGCTRQNIKKLALALQKKNLASLKVDPKDHRSVLLSPTNATEEFFKGDFAPYLNELNTLFSSYSNDELALFFQLLTKLGPILDEMEEPQDKGEGKK